MSSLPSSSSFIWFACSIILADPMPSARSSGSMTAMRRFSWRICKCLQLKDGRPLSNLWGDNTLPWPHNSSCCLGLVSKRRLHTRAHFRKDLRTTSSEWKSRSILILGQMTIPLHCFRARSCKMIKYQLCLHDGRGSSAHPRMDLQSRSWSVLIDYRE